jgi:hypothetical protein
MPGEIMGVPNKRALSSGSSTDGRRLEPIHVRLSRHPGGKLGHPLSGLARLAKSWVPRIAGASGRNVEGHVYAKERSAGRGVAGDMQRIVSAEAFEAIGHCKRQALPVNQIGPTVVGALASDPPLGQGTGRTAPYVREMLIERIAHFVIATARQRTKTRQQTTIDPMLDMDGHMNPGHPLSDVGAAIFSDLAEKGEKEAGVIFRFKHRSGFGHLQDLVAQ